AEISLLQSFASQAVIAMEVARLLTEQHEALERQTATAELLQIINFSPGDPKPVFEAILEKSLSLCEASFGLMNTHDGERFLRVAQRGLPPAFNEWRDANPVSSVGIPQAFQRLIAGDRVVHRVDVRMSEAYPSDPNVRALVDLAGARTEMIVPLRRGHTVCGMFKDFRPESRAVHGKQTAMVHNFAAPAGTPMDTSATLVV